MSVRGTIFEPTERPSETDINIMSLLYVSSSEEHDVAIFRVFSYLEDGEK
jgi:hypothetical protein